MIQHSYSTMLQLCSGQAQIGTDFIIVKKQLGPNGEIIWGVSYFNQFVI